MIDYEFEVWCNDGYFLDPRCVASVSAKTREEGMSEAMNYVTQYSADGRPCEIWEVIRRKVWPE